MGGASIGVVLGHIERRRFLLALAGVAVVAATGCRPTSAAPRPPKQPPGVPSAELGRPKLVEHAEAYLVAVPERVRERALALLDADLHAGVKAGVLALSMRCPKDRFKLPYCESSGWFECPNCGSKFTRLGDKMAGPAPHGMDMFGVEVERDGDVNVVRGRRVQGLALETRLIASVPEGPHCA